MSKQYFSCLGNELNFPGKTPVLLRIFYFSLKISSHSPVPILGTFQIGYLFLSLRNCIIFCFLCSQRTYTSSWDPWICHSISKSILLTVALSILLYSIFISSSWVYQPADLLIKSSPSWPAEILAWFQRRPVRSPEAARRQISPTSAGSGSVASRSVGLSAWELSHWENLRSLLRLLLLKNQGQACS